MDKREDKNVDRLAKGDAKIKPKNAMKLHAKHFAHLQPEQKAKLNAVADQARSSAEQQRGDDIEEVLTSIALAESRKDDVASSGTMRVSGCRWQPAVLSRLDELFSGIRRQSKVAKEVRDASLFCPEPLLADVFEQKRSTNALPLPSAVEHSKLYREVCCLRQYFRDAVFCFHFESFVIWLRPVLFMCKPTLMMYLPLQETSFEDAPFFVGSGGLHATGEFDFEHLWTYNARDVAYNDPFSLPGCVHVTVVMQSRFLEGNYLGAWHEA
eukprot:888623-Amphidinium_carterae.1